MMNLTDIHCRYFHRLLTSCTMLYTEMVTANAIIYGKNHNFLMANKAKNPVAFQLGGSCPKTLASCTRIIEDYAYVEVNLNAGCPSSKTQNGNFGACLMAKSELLAECVFSMQQAVSIPVTVKLRIGIDNQDSYPELAKLIATVASAGCKTFIVHARKAWLKGLSPKQNRNIPPLRYDVVYQLKQDFPELEIILNGGITSLTEASTILKRVDGVMMGREAYHNPYLLTQVDYKLYSSLYPQKTRHKVVMELLPYIKSYLNQGGKLHNITRHILGLFRGLSGSRAWRQILSEKTSKDTADEQVVLEALKQVSL